MPLRATMFQATCLSFLVKTSKECFVHLFSYILVNVREKLNSFRNYTWLRIYEVHLITFGFVLLSNHEYFTYFTRENFLIHTLIMFIANLFSESFLPETFHCHTKRSYLYKRFVVQTSHCFENRVTD